MALCQKKRSRDSASDQGSAEDSAYSWSNWGIVILLQAIISTCYSIILPSMHQFLTTPGGNTHDINDANATDDFEIDWPGLGQSESIYSWAVTMYSTGELAGALVAGQLIKYVPYRHAILWACGALIFGSLFYGIAVTGWMVLVGRLLIGIHAGLGIVLVTSYIGETTTELSAKMDAKQLRKKKGKTLKDKLFVWYSVSMNVAYPVALVVCSIMAQFEWVDPYRWAAWLGLALNILYIVAFVAIFREDKQFKLPKCVGRYRKKAKKTKSEGNKIVLYSFLVFSGYVAGATYTPLDTLLNPVLSDQFGFKIADSSYLMLGVMMMIVASSGLQFILKKFRMDNRQVFILCLLMIIVGSVVISDWQSIGEDPCSAVTQEDVYRAAREANQTAAAASDEVITETSDTKLFRSVVELCEAASTDEYHCYWNQDSQITGEYCNECYAVCRSTEMSLNFLQFCVGISLLAICIPISNIIITVIASDAVPLEFQGTMMSLLYAAMGLARLISPIWVDATYELSGKHTYLPMGITAGTYVVTLAIFVAFYKQLTPRMYVTQRGDVEESQPTSSVISLSEEKKEGILV